MSLVGKMVQTHRTIKKLSLREAAKRAGYSASYLSDIETGKKLIGIEPAMKLAMALDLDVRELVQLSLQDKIDGVRLNYKVRLLNANQR